MLDSAPTFNNKQKSSNLKGEKIHDQPVYFKIWDRWSLTNVSWGCVLDLCEGKQNAASPTSFIQGM